MSESDTEHFYKKTFHIRESFIAPFRNPEDAGKAFDVWLAGVKAEVAATALEKAASEIGHFAKSAPDRDSIVEWLSGVAALYRKGEER